MIQDVGCETAVLLMGVAEGWRRCGWGSRGDCRLPGGLEEIHAAPLRGGNSSRDGLSTSSALREKDCRLGISPLQSFRTLLFLTACL